MLHIVLEKGWPEAYKYGILLQGILQARTINNTVFLQGIHHIYKPHIPATYTYLHTRSYTAYTYSSGVQANPMYQRYVLIKAHIRS